MGPGDDLRGELVRRLQELQALKVGALRLFDPMLASVAAARDGDELEEVSDLLGRMHTAFGGHRRQTAEDAEKLAQCLRALGAEPARRRAGIVGLGAALRAKVGGIGGLNYGAAAREAFVFEHLEIAEGSLLEQLAVRAGDEPTAQVAREVVASDEEMAATIGRNWTNVLSLSLAARGLPVHRPPEEEEGS